MAILVFGHGFQGGSDPDPTQSRPFLGLGSMFKTSKSNSTRDPIPI